MEIVTSYAVKTFFPNTSFTQIYFEAIANAFDAKADEVKITIFSDGDISPDYLEIRISDNGQGFTDERFQRFRRLQEPKDRYHKGLGRLVYLQYFSNVNIESVYGTKKRNFMFSEAFNGDSEVTDALPSDAQETHLRFSGFLGNRLKSYDDVKPVIIKQKLIEHFLPLFYSRKKTELPFKIIIELQTEGKKQKEFYPDIQTVTLSDVPQFETLTFQDLSVHAFAEISMSYTLRHGVGENQFLTAACIDGRTVPIKLLQQSAIPPNHSAIFLFESDLFTGKSDSSRQRLVLPDSIPEISLHRLLRRQLSAVLNDRFPEIEQKNAKTRQYFEDRYPHLTGLFDENAVGIIDKDEAIEQAQRRFLKQQKEVLESDSMDDATFEKSLEVSSRALTEYILYRELIIKRLSETRPEDREDVIHNIIVPKYRRYDEENMLSGIYSNNAWLLDDKYMTFRTILSEAKMKEVIAAITLDEDVEDDGRPDISMIFSSDPDLVEKVDVVVVELKRRTVDDKENLYAATQLVKRARKLIDHCPNIQRVWYFGVVEIDDEFAQTLADMKWTPLFSKGKVFYQDFQVKRSDGVPVPTPVCLLSFDAIIKDAASRNHTFFELLKSDMKKSRSKSDAC